jgi:hypothetical protein
MRAKPTGAAATDAVQEDVIRFLANPASYPRVDRVDRFETHANLVFLAGEQVRKIKRAVRFAYLDFSTLEKRHAACVREVEINRKFGSALYLEPIARSRGGTLAFGTDGDIIEWCVHMRRFDQSALLSNIARLRQRVYEALSEKARAVLAARHSVIVDAVFAESNAATPAIVPRQLEIDPGPFAAQWKPVEATGTLLATLAAARAALKDFEGRPHDDPQS